MIAAKLMMDNHICNSRPR